MANKGVLNASLVAEQWILGLCHCDLTAHGEPRLRFVLRMIISSSFIAVVMLLSPFGTAGQLAKDGIVSHHRLAYGRRSSKWTGTHIIYKVVLL